MYYDFFKFKDEANKKLENEGITGGDLDNDELDMLYKAWVFSPATTFSEFFNSFEFMTTDDIADNFNIDYQTIEDFTWEEICEYLTKEEQEINGAMKLSTDLFIVIL